MQKKTANRSGIFWKAIEHYIHNVVPSQRLVRPQVMEAYRRSNEKFWDLYQKLAR